MIITNVQHLPQAFVEMAKDEFEMKPKTYRVTSLLKGVRETLLEKRHKSEIKQDCSDMIWLLFGTAVHKILEIQTEAAHEIKETRLQEEINGLIVSGQFDLYDTIAKTIKDYKTCSVWKVIYGDYSDWRKQLLIYAYLLRCAGFEVTGGEIIAIMKDHSKREAKYKPDYPQLPVKKICFTFSELDFDTIKEFLNEKTLELLILEPCPDDELPLCTPEERYNSGDKFAVTKKGNKKAMRVLDSKEAAEEWMVSNGGDSIESRPGEDKKCLDYCSACQFCNHYKEIIGGTNET